MRDMFWISCISFFILLDMVCAGMGYQQAAWGHILVTMSCALVFACTLYLKHSSRKLLTRIVSEDRISSITEEPL